MHLFILYNKFWLILSVKISLNRNNTNGKLYWIWCLNLQLYFLYIHLLLSLKEIFPPQLISIYFIVNLILNRWNIWLKIFVEKKWMLTIYRVQFVLITKTHVDNWISRNSGTFVRRTLEYQRTGIVFVNTVEWHFKQLQLWPNYLLA